MSDTDPKTPSKGGAAAAATGAAWTDTERMAYLIVIAEHALEAPIESKISQAPVPGGRNVNACRKIIKKLKDRLKDDIENIKAGRPVVSSVDGDTAATPGKATPRKRKTDSGEDGDASPKKKATPRKMKSEATVKDEEEVNGEV
ncbi:uncharacterized protein M421DRAFT_371447 [Didymella exigua CBS 183.55]|uniref:Myb-like domain-containing protein n=1 Tax=Didymella exigua CBS 183.55 TaxID=1150837 RepID=A0A6A5RPJ5_9PLEO|nr:uncharacterized protein M421DRAFT_371447 [Didymella exigua CBS 183.55]KAF1930325.1 hypothetical protein M421DRAFT_371447 [Didymella exigua CBS 183.55]